ncbi:MAG: hypothetical protein AAF297_07895 [Planctomycetota bacterium]
MRQGSKLVLNTVAIATQTTVTIALALVTTRLLFRELGAVDLGVFMVIGASAGLINIIADAMTDSAGRHMAHALGRGDKEGVLRIFNTVLGIYAGLAGTVLVLGAILAWPVTGLLSGIPEDRLDAARWVFLSTVGIIALTSLIAPFRAVLVSHQKQYIQSVVQIGYAALRLLAVLALTVWPEDKLVGWALLVLGVQATVLTTYFFVVFGVAKHLRIRPSLFSKAEVKGLVGYGGWQVANALAWRLRMQGSQVALNILFGPTFNTSYGLGAQVSAYQRKSGGTVFQSFNPAIIHHHGGDRPKMVERLVLTSTRFTALAAGLIAVPLLVLTPEALGVWLGAERIEELPMLTGFVQLMVISVFAGIIAQPLNSTVNATGKIGGYTMSVLGVETVGFVSGVLAVVAFGAQALAIPAAAAMSTTVLIAVKAGWAWRAVGLSPLLWVVKGLLPGLGSVAIGAGVAWYAASLASGDVARLLVGSIVNAGVLGVLGVTVIATKEERGRVLGMIKGLRRRGPRGGGGPPASPTTPSPSAAPASPGNSG